MYKGIRATAGTLKVNKCYTGETIEAKVRRMTNNKEPIKDTGPLNYTERKDGVLPEYDIRTDRMEFALEAMDKASKSEIAKRAYRGMTIEEQQEFDAKRAADKAAKTAAKTGKASGNDGKPESTGGK